jgi:SAM-dependent methyltransferase
MFNKKNEYKKKIMEQIRQYQHTDNMHAQLSDIFRYWQEKYFRERFREVCEVNNHLEFYWKPFAKRIQQTGCHNLISFGCGDAQVETGVATGLKKEGIDDFRFHCVELSPAQIKRARDFVEKAGLAKNFVFIEGDFNVWEPNGQLFAGAMCHHALHHVLELEHLIAAIRSALHPQGCFVCIDVIGRNGHMRWPEALEITEMIWRMLPEEKRYHHILKRLDKEYVNHDCSTEGFEGVRSQDILPILTQNFKFEKFLAFGNLVDVFTSRGFGANFDSNNELDMAFIDFVQYLNDLLIDLGHIKPTRMCAIMVLENENPTKTYKHWTPEFCIRKPEC